MSETTVIWTTEALNDLLDIEEFLGTKAESTIDRIIARTRQLENFPNSGQKQETTSRQVYRYLIEGNYKIIYSHRPSKVFVHIVFDTRQDPGKLKI